MFGSPCDMNIITAIDRNGRAVLIITRIGSKISYIAPSNSVCVFEIPDLSIRSRVCVFSCPCYVKIVTTIGRNRDLFLIIASSC